MSSASMIPLMGQQPVINNPIQNVMQLLNAKDLSSQIGLRSAQTQQAQQQANDLAQQAQQRQRALKDQDTIRQALSDPNHPEYATQWGKGDTSFLDGKVDPATLSSVQQGHAKALQDLATLDSTKLANLEAGHRAAGESLAGLQNLYDSAESKVPGAGAAAVASAWPTVAAHLKATPGLENTPIPQAIDGSPTTLASLAAQANAASAFYNAGSDLQKKQADAKKLDADAQLSQQKADLQKKWADQFMSNPQTGSALIDRIMAGDPAAASFKAALSATPSVEAGQEIIKAATAHAAERQAKLDPAIANAEIETAARKASASANAEIGPHVQEALQKQLAVAKASPDMFAAIADPVARRQAEEGYTKLSLDSQQQVSDAKRLQEYVQAAQSGNKAAAGLIPIAELRQIVNRVNGAELKAAGTPGNIIDKGIGALNGLVNGVPISNEGLKAIADLSQAQENNTLKNYQAKIRVMSQVYGNPKLKPLDLEVNYTGAKGSSASFIPPNVASALKDLGPGIHNLSDGSRWMKDANGNITKQ